MFELIAEGTVNCCAKKHRCAWCNEWIEKGESAQKVTVKIDGEFQTDRYHPECYRAVKKTAEEVGSSFAFPPGEFERGVPADEESPIDSW